MADARLTRGFVAVLVVGSALRMWASTLGYNFDLGSWWEAGVFVDQGRNVWVNTHRIPYGPVLPGIAWTMLRLERLGGWTSMEVFHVLMASVLTASDVGIALLLRRMRGQAAASVFFLCPVSILITGYHSQIETLAVLAALWSWHVMESRPVDGPARSMIWPGVLLGLSLATKHIFALLPIWVLLCRERPVRQRLVYGAVAGACFVAAFVPFVLTPESWAGVRDHVVLYRGDQWFGNALLPRLIDNPQRWTLAAIVALLVTGAVVARWAPRELFFFYPIALVAFGTTMADQYLAIPIVSVGAYWRRWPMWAYVAMATLVLLGSPNDVGSLPAMEAIATRLRSGGFILTPDRASTLYPQICLVVFLVVWPLRAAQRRVVVHFRGAAAT